MENYENYLTIKEMTKDLRQYHLALLFNRERAKRIRLEATKKIHLFSTGDLDIRYQDAKMMYTYLRTFGYMKKFTVTKDAYNSFFRLNWMPASPYPHILRNLHASIYNGVSIITRNIAKTFNRYDRIYSIPTSETASERPVAAEQKKKNNAHKITTFFRQHKNKIIGLFITAGVLFGSGKYAKTAIADKQSAKIENIVPVASHQAAPKTIKTNIAATPADSLSKIYKNYYNTALEIHLGAEKRDRLYANLNNQLNKGNLKLPQSESMEHLAHTITISALVQPNAPITKLLKKAVSNKLSPQEQQAVWKFVAQAGDKGQNIKGTGTHSNFNHRKDLQKEHIKNLKQLRYYKAHAGR